MNLATPLVPLEPVDPTIYAKIEYGHPSGSLKHRALPPLLAARKRMGGIQPGQTLAVLSAGAGAVTVAWTAAHLGHPCLTILPRTAPRHIVRLVRWLGATCEQIGPEEIDTVLARLRGDPNTYLVSQAHEPEIVDYYRPVAREVLAELPGAAAIVVGIGTGASITGIAREIRDRGATCHVFGVEPAEAAVASGHSWAPHTIHGLAPPLPQELLEKGRLSEILTVPSVDAWRCARNVHRRVGLPVGPSSGATIAGAMLLRQRGFEGPIVAVCACSMNEYLDDAPRLDSY